MDETLAARAREHLLKVLFKAGEPLPAAELRRILTNRRYMADAEDQTALITAMIADGSMVRRFLDDGPRFGLPDGYVPPPDTGRPVATPITNERAEAMKGMIRQLVGEGVVKRREILRGARAAGTADECAAILAAMVEAGEIHTELVAPASGPGRPGLCFRLTPSDEPPRQTTRAIVLTLTGDEVATVERLAAAGGSLQDAIRSLIRGAGSGAG